MSHTRRTYPLFPIPAVGAVILQDDHVLLIQRGQAPAQGKWTLPGGAIEVGESPEEALLREIREECHLEIILQGILEVINKIAYDSRGKIKYHYIVLDFLAECPSVAACREFRVQADSDALAACWVPIEDIHGYDTTDGLEEIIQKGITLARQLNEQ